MTSRELSMTAATPHTKLIQEPETHKLIRVLKLLIGSIWSLFLQ